MKNYRFQLIFVLFAVINTNVSYASDTTFNLGYHNPPGALIGANLLTFWNKWAFELGIGWVDVEGKDTNNDDDDEFDSLATQIGGAMSLKYFLTPGFARFYLQGGIGLGLAASVGDDNDVDAGASSLFGGAGVLLGSNKFYFYGAYNLGQHTDGFLQAGLGFDI